jgi:predicted O-methyltransferase YrrM
MKEQLEKLFIWPDEKPNVPPNMHHWFGGENADILGRLIDSINPKYILEIGSWTGAGSTKFMLDRAPNTHMVCIDHWSKNFEDFVQKDFGIEQVKEIGGIISVLWETFLVNTWEHRHHMTPIRAKTVEGLQIIKDLNIPFDLIYIDAHHDYESVLHDIRVSVENWPNATICGDDYNWPDGGVANAVNEYAETNNLNVNGSGDCWYYTKK